MKNWFRKYPNLWRLIIAALLIAASLIGSSFIHIAYVPVGCVLVILVTWGMFRNEGQSLGTLGFDLKPKHLLLIPFGLLLGAVSYLLSFYLGTLVRGDHIAISREVNWMLLWNEFWRTLPTAVVQDFIVVGYCYLQLIRLTNKRTATLLFALFFISLHDVWGGNPINLFFYASTLFAGYIMFATALLRSGSIWLVIGIHWANNFTNSCLLTFSRTSTSLMYISSAPNTNLNVWQAIGLYIASLIGALSVIFLTRYIWRSGDRLKPGTI